jgi:Fe-S-cluster-containing hydrogenase component 2
VIAKVNEDLCMGCGVCEEVCPTDAITMEGEVARVNGELCTGCGECVEVCPADAVTLN